MTEKEKQQAGELYNANDRELFNDRIKAKKLCAEYNTIECNDFQKRERTLDRLLALKGQKTVIEPDFFSGQFGPGQVFMLCSDGFRHVINEAELYNNLNPSVLVNEQVMKDRAYYLTELNKSRMERDNITVILVKTV